MTPVHLIPVVAVLAILFGPALFRSLDLRPLHAGVRRTIADLEKRKRPADAIRLARAARRTPWSRVPAGRWLIGQDLAYLYKRAGRHKEAITIFRELLASPICRPSTQGNLHDAIAQSLEALGDWDAAAAESALAEPLLIRTAAFPQSDKQKGNACTALGRLLTRDGRHSDAAYYYETALAVSAPSQAPAISRKLLRAVLNARDPVRAVALAERIIADPGQGHRDAHRCAASAYADIGDLDAAEKHADAYAALSASAAAEPLAASPSASSASLTPRILRSSLRILRGDIAASIKDLEPIVSDPDAVQGAIAGAISLSAAYTLQGDYAKALEMARQAKDRVGDSQNPSMRRFRALAQQHIARLILSGVRDGAFPPEDLINVAPALAAARTDLQHDPRALDCDMLEATLLAADGKADEALALIAAIEEQRLARYASSRGALLLSLACYARVAQTLGQYERAIAYRRTSLTCCHPVGRPAAFRNIGECFEALADIPAARDAYQQAVATGLETADTAKARARLVGYRRLGSV